MNERYKHTQVGYLIISLFIGFIILIVYLMFLYGFNWIIPVILITMTISMILFCTLTVIIKDDILEIRFGPGLIRKKFSIRNIESCRIVKNPWYYGWGIRITPHGWLYNVSGFYAVEIKMKTGEKYRIGTDEPENLYIAIQKAKSKV